jgi:hypothetical protein
MRNSTSICYFFSGGLPEEESFLAPFLESARCGGVLVVGEIHRVNGTPFPKILF